MPVYMLIAFLVISLFRRHKRNRRLAEEAAIEKQQKLAEIRVQQQETSKSVNMGKAVLSSLN